MRSINSNAFVEFIVVRSIINWIILIIDDFNQRTPVSVFPLALLAKWPLGFGFSWFIYFIYFIYVQ